MKNTIEKLYSILFILLGLSIPLSIATANILAGLIIICWIKEGNLRGKWKEIKTSKWMISILFLLVFYCLGIMWGNDHKNLIWIIPRLSLLLVFIVFATSKFNQSTLKWGTLLFIFSTLVSAILAILINQKIILPLHNYIPIISSENSISAFTTYNYHNILLAFSSLICLFLFLEKKVQYRWILLMCIVIYSFSIFTESGRAGQLIFILFLGIYSIYYFRKKISYSIGIITFLIICIYAASQFSDQFKFRIKEAKMMIQNEMIQTNSKNPHKDQNDIRIVFIKESINYIKKKPILGYGTGSFGTIFKKEIKSGHEYLVHTTPHNTYLYVWFEIGIFGLIILLSIFYFQIKSLSKLEYSFHRILLPIGFMTIMLFDAYLFSFVLTIFYIYFFTVYNNYKVDKTT
ncbi:MAG: O-antigen ligase family protein [Flavobacteriales bacterium]